MTLPTTSKREQQWITLSRQEAAALLRLGATTCQYEQGRMRWWLPANLGVELADDGEWTLWVVPPRGCSAPTREELFTDG